MPPARRSGAELGSRGLAARSPPSPGHTLGNSAAWLHAWLHARNVSDWASRLALVVHTPLGMALPRHWQPLVGALVPAHSIKTLAE